MRAPALEAGRRRQLLAVIVGGSILVRAAAAVALGNQVEALPGIADQVSYHTLALRVLGGHGFTFGEPWWPATQPNSPTAHWSYLYTLALAAIYAVAGAAPLVVRLLQAAVVGVALPALVYWLGRRLFDARAALVAAALAAGYAYFVYYAAALMTEAVYICGVLLALCLAIRLSDAWLPGRGAPAPTVYGLAVALGLALGLTVLLRQVFLLFVPVLFAWLAWVGLRRHRLRQAVLGLGVAGALVALLILPFTWFNYQRFGEFVLLNTNAGYAFYFANHPVYGTQFEPILSAETATYLDLLPTELKGLNEAQLDQELMRRGLGFVAADPARYLQLSLSRLPALFMFWPSSDSSLLGNVARVGSFGWLWPFMLGGALLAAFEYLARRRPDGQALEVLLLFAAVYCLIHIFSWSLVRYRLPVDAVLLVPAAHFFVALYDWLRGRFRLVAASEGG